MSIPRQSLVAIIVLAASFSSTASAQTVLYRETFGIPLSGSNNQNSINWDWVRFQTSGAAAATTVGISNSGVGKPTDLANTPSAGPNADGTTDAYADGWIYMENNERIAFTTEYTFDPVALGPITFRWWQGANYDQPTVGLNEGRVAVRIGSSWFASSEVFTNTAVTSGGAFGNAVGGAEPKSLLYNPAAANWRTIAFDGQYDSESNLTGDSSLGNPVLGDPPAAALTGPITAFGLYRAVTGSNFRFDTYTIESGGGTTASNANFDAVGPVDGADYLIWQRGLALTGQTTNANGDADGSGTVDAADLAIWRTQYGTTPISAIPEPGSLALLVVAAAALAARRRSV